MDERGGAGKGVRLWLLKLLGRRRLVVLIAGSLAVWCLFVGVALFVFKRAVVAPSGAESPSAAVQGVFGSLGVWADDDALQVLRYLCRERADELRDRVRGIRSDLARQEGTVLSPSGFAERPGGGGVRVSVQVSAVTPIKQGGQTLFAHSEAHEWRFDTVGSGKTWRVCGWDAPNIGVYV